MLRAAFERRPEIELVTPWTRLPSLDGGNGSDTPEMLIVELPQRRLPRALRTLLCSAARLRIIGLASDARSAVVYRVVDQQTVMLDCSASDLCAVMDSAR